MGDVLDVTIFAARAARGAQERRYPGDRRPHRQRSSGWLGAFELAWTQDNPIDLDLCTRCNACVAVCPEDAIGLDYQIDLAKCTSHRACVKACDVAGAIDFSRASRGARPSSFDLVLDLRAAARDRPACAAAGLLPPAGGLASGPRRCRRCCKLREMVGEFEKPKFFDYKQKLCAHSRNETVGCNACIEVCSAAGDQQRQVAPADQGQPQPVRRLRRLHHRLPDRRADLHLSARARAGPEVATLLSTYAKAGGARRRCCCCTARSAARRWWRNSAARRSWARRRACRPT